MSVECSGYAAFSAHEPLRPWRYYIRDPGPDEILIQTCYSGLCHSDIHTLRSEWGPCIYPCIAGHEFVGLVAEIGTQVTRHQVGDKVGVGCYVRSCRSCERCIGETDLSHYCDKSIATYNDIGPDGKPTYGGYGTWAVVSEHCAVNIPESLPFDRIAPLLCAGITMWSPIKHLRIERGHLKVGVIGLGGLGHMALQFAAKLNPSNSVYVFSRTPAKKDLALELGAKGMIVTSDPEEFKKHDQTFDYILDTVSSNKDMAPYISCLKLDGTLCIVGLPPADDQPKIPVFPMIMRRRSILGSTIGSYTEAQEMLNFCAEKNVVPVVEVVSCDKVNECFERVLKSDVKFRFVFDVMSTAPPSMSFNADGTYQP